MDERRFDRIRELLGDAAFLELRRASVTVVGLGGVGAHAALALARSGVGSLTLVDFDLVTATSLNRSPVALPADVGRPKTDVLAESLAASCPDTSVSTLKLFFHHDTADQLLDRKPDIVVDAIDSLNPKTALLECCLKRGIPVVSSMGASGRTDPSLVRTGDISETGGCPLARQVRKYLRRRGITEGVPCVWSVEPAGDHALPPDLEGLIQERGRIRNRIPSSIVMPGIFGYALASLVIRHLCRGNTPADRSAGPLPGS
jgi:tRNA A37 threonylcarbamoyladenosine dehydratase